jgi:imidazolonepropionase-like amidohydrolase
MIRRVLRSLAVLAVLAVALPASLAMPALAGGDLVVKGGIVHTMAGPPLRDGIVVVRGGRITAVGPAATTALPAGVRVLEAAVVTPGLVDAHSVVGLAGYLNQKQDQDQLERSEALQPELRAIDAYDARERLVEWVRGFGVTTLHTGHAPGNLISGQTLLAKTRGDTVEEAVFDPEVMVAASLGEAGINEEKGKAPGTRSKAMALLRGKLVEAQGYREKRAAKEESERPARDLRLETLVRVLDGEMPLLVTAHRHHDLMSALRLADELGLRVVLDGAADAYLLIDEIKSRNVPVILHPTMWRPTGDAENLSWESAGRLQQAGVLVALQSSYESYVPKTRVVLFEAAVAAANGLGCEGALRTITIDAARVVGAADRIGSLEVGKDGDLALYDGDPFEYLTHCVGTVIEGELVHEGAR